MYTPDPNPTPIAAETLLERYARGQRDFTGTSLRGARLPGIILQRCDLTDANLDGTDLR